MNMKLKVGHYYLIRYNVDGMETAVAKCIDATNYYQSGIFQLIQRVGWVHYTKHDKIDNCWFASVSFTKEISKKDLVLYLLQEE